MPSTQREWENIAKNFFDQWNYPNCIGAIDGKHVVMVAPPNSGSIYYNYKGTHSIVLMALCDANYRFIYIDVGCNGRISDGGVFNKCSFAQAMNCKKLNLPPDIPLPGREKPVPFVVVADDAFAMRTNVMKPFPGRMLSVIQRVHNYRLSRARRVVENAFGILAARFRIFRSPIHLDASKTRRVTLACCALHNFLISKSSSYISSTMIDRYDDNGALIPGRWRNNSMPESFAAEESIPTPYIPNTAKEIREEFAQYFVSVEGELSYQYQNN